MADSRSVALAHNNCHNNRTLTPEFGRFGPSRAIWRGDQRHSLGVTPGVTVESAVALSGHLAQHTYRGRSTMKYEKPAVQRFGSLREVTLGNGPRLGGDAVSLYHRS